MKLTTMGCESKSETSSYVFFLKYYDTVCIAPLFERVDSMFDTRALIRHKKLKWKH